MLRLTTRARCAATTLGAGAGMGGPRRGFASGSTSTSSRRVGGGSIPASLALALAAAGAGAAGLALGRGRGLGLETEASVAHADAPKPALSPSEFRKFRVVDAKDVSPNTKLIRVELPPDSTSGLTVASCVVARAEIDGKAVTRPYTPVSLNSQVGFVDFLVKVYPAPGGVMSRHITSLRPDADVVEIKGPFKKLEYKPNMKKRVGMIAGGTGVTPMLQIIREILSNPEDMTQVSLVFANVTEADILLREELDALAYLYPNFKVFYTLDKPPRGWTGGSGFVSKDMIRAHLPPPGPDNLVLVCGPKGMVELVSGPKGPKDTQGELTGLLAELGFDASQVYKF